MNKFGLMSLLLAICFVVAGCGGDAKKEDPKKDEGSQASNVSTHKDICGKCGCCAGCDECCKGEKCEKCGMQKGSDLCCSGVAAKDGVVYCGKCGFEKGSATCCAAANAKCDKCGLASGSPLCCKLK